MKITKRKYLDKKYLHDIDKWEEDTRNRVNTAVSIASSGIGALSGATLSRNIKSKPGRAAAILLPAYAMGTGGYVISDKSAGDYIKKVADWRRAHYNDESKSGKQEMRQIKLWITHEDKADKRMKSLEKKNLVMTTRFIKTVEEISDSSFCSWYWRSCSWYWT